MWDAFQQALSIYNEKAAGDLPIAKQPRDPTPGHPPDPAADPHVPSVLFNGMIAPVLPFGIKGVAWYQGERNAPFPVDYASLLPVMIGDWRSRWGQGDFPFLIVQLANYGKRYPEPQESNWAALREVQAKVAGQPHNGLATAIDIGDGGNLHPQDKDDLGARLALAARQVAYGDTSVIASGPTLAKAAVDGTGIRLSFNNEGSGLVIGVPPAHWHPGKPRPDATVLNGFAIAGADGKYVWADARIDGNDVVVSSPQVPQPATVRYDWGDDPNGNLYNKEGLPAIPFRTDDAPVGELQRKAGK